MKKLKRETHICHIYYQVTAHGEKAQDMQVEKNLHKARYLLMGRRKDKQNKKAKFRVIKNTWKKVKG